MVQITDIKFDEQYNNTNYETTTLYYTAPIEFLDEFDIEYNSGDVGSEISMEFPMNNISAGSCYGVSLSPTDDSGCDYDWWDVDVDNDFIDKLLSIVPKEHIIIENE